MGKASLRNLLAHKGRLALSLLAVVLSAGFVAGTLIFTDTLQSSFDDLFAGTSSDVVVSPAETDAPGVERAGRVHRRPGHRARVHARRPSAAPRASPRRPATCSSTAPRSSAPTASRSLGNGPTFGTNWEPDDRLTAAHHGRGRGTGR